MRNRRKVWNCGLILATVLGLGGSQFFIAWSQTPKQRPPSGKKSSPPIDDFLNPANGPLSLQKILDLLSSVQQGVETEGRVIRGIQARGIDFPMTSANTQKILAAGGSENLRKILESKAPPPPTASAPALAPKKEEAKGTLNVQCKPAECEVAVRGSSPVPTRNGAASLSGLDPGETYVDVGKAGYFGQQLPVTIKSGAPTSLAVQLEPDNNTQLQLGARLFQAMVEAAGGESVKKDLAALSVMGSATLFDPAGAGTEWNLNVTLRPGQATFEAKSAAGGLKLDCKGETCQVQTGGRLFFGKRLPAERAQALETALRQFRRFHFTALLDRLVAAKPQATAKTADVPASGEQHLNLEVGSETYAISLDAHLLPTFLKVDSKTGLGSGTTISYSDYAAVGASHYPRATEIKLPDGKQGLQVRLGSLNSSPGSK